MTGQIIIKTRGLFSVWTRYEQDSRQFDSKQFRPQPFVECLQQVFFIFFVYLFEEAGAYCNNNARTPFGLGASHPPLLFDFNLWPTWIAKKLPQVHTSEKRGS
jgi:hypothetical protein